MLGFLIGPSPASSSASLLGRVRFLVRRARRRSSRRANAIPRIVLGSIFVIWFGLGMSSKVATAFVLVFFAVFFNAFQGAREVDRVTRRQRPHPRRAAAGR